VPLGQTIYMCSYQYVEASLPWLHIGYLSIRDKKEKIKVITDFRMVYQCRLTSSDTCATTLCKTATKFIASTPASADNCCYSCCIRSALHHQALPAGLIVFIQSLRAVLALGIHKVCVEHLRIVKSLVPNPFRLIIELQSVNIVFIECDSVAR
jgi:hypothetical protein